MCCHTINTTTDCTVVVLKKKYFDISTELPSSVVSAKLHNQQQRSLIVSLSSSVGLSRIVGVPIDHIDRAGAKQQTGAPLQGAAIFAATRKIAVSDLLGLERAWFCAFRAVEHYSSR